MKIKADLHIHTFYSPDSIITFQTLIKICKRRKINCVAITDHNTIKGAVEFSKISPLKVIIGEEIDTKDGEIIGYFLKKEIRKGLSAEDTVYAIKEQDGLVCIPHPFDKLRGSALNPDKLMKIIDDVDIIEGVNGRVFKELDNALAIEFAVAYKKQVSAGSDAHTALEIGIATVELEDFNSKEEFLKNLEDAKIYNKVSHPIVHIFSTGIKIAKKILK